MTATLLKFPKDRVNLDEKHHGGAEILKWPKTGRQTLCLKFNPSLFCWEWVWM